jgi:hypothetical protein
MRALKRESGSKILVVTERLARKRRTKDETSSQERVMSKAKPLATAR